MIRPHMDYRVSITLHDFHEPATIRLSIEDGLKYKNEKTVTISSNQTDLVSLRIDDLDIHKGYKFVAEGISGFVFKNESSLRLQSKNESIFIQTDKAIYKPGETVKFLALVLDHELKPVSLSTVPLNIHITDPERNRIKQWSNVNSIFGSEMPISEFPVLGEWSIEASIGDEVKFRLKLMNQ